MSDDITYGSSACSHTRDRREQDLLKALDDAWAVLDHVYSEGQNLPVQIHGAAERSRKTRDRLDPPSQRMRRSQAR